VLRSGPVPAVLYSPGCPASTCRAFRGLSPSFRTEPALAARNADVYEVFLAPCASRWGRFARLAHRLQRLDVGLGVGSDPLQGGEPSTIDVTPTTRDTTVAPITGDNVQERPRSQNAWRFLVGTVDDPTPGTGVVETEGYVDFAGRSDLPPAIDTADAEDLTAELRLTTDYFHGRSTESMEVEVYDLTDEATMDSARATERFEAAPSAVSVNGAQINPSDSLVTIQLQQEPAHPQQHGQRRR